MAFVFTVRSCRFNVITATTAVIIQYHAPFRRVENKFAHDEPRVDRTFALRLAKKATSDTMGPNGLLRSLLEFGMIPRFTAVNARLSQQVARIRSLDIARTEMATVASELRIREALRSHVHPSATYTIAPGVKVRVYLESNKITGPFTVIDFQDRNGKLVYHNISQVIPEHRYVRTATPTSVVHRPKPLTWSQVSSKKKKHRGLCQFPSDFNNRSRSSH